MRNKNNGFLKFKVKGMGFELAGERINVRIYKSEIVEGANYDFFHMEYEDESFKGMYPRSEKSSQSVKEASKNFVADAIGALRTTAPVQLLFYCYASKEPEWVVIES